MLDFGGFWEKVTPLQNGLGAVFNKSLEAVALKNEEKENNFSQLANIITTIEVITRIKHAENDLNDLTVITVAGGFESLLQKLSQSKKAYNCNLQNDPVKPSKDNYLFFRIA